MQKLYFSISEISEMIDEEQHILRYWEKESPQLKPRKNRKGNRVYSDKDLALLKLIKKLIREDKLSLKGAKDYIEKMFKKSQNLDNSLFFDYEIEQHIQAVDVNPILKDILKKEKNSGNVNVEILKEVRNMLGDILNHIK